MATNERLAAEIPAGTGLNGHCKEAIRYGSLTAPAIRRLFSEPTNKELAAMSERSTGLKDNSICPATAQDAPQLADLYAKQFIATGFNRIAATENREELIKWVEELSRENELWIIRDSLGPVVLGHYKPSSSEIITIVTRDDMEGQGYGSRMLCALATADPSVEVHPVTKSGKALAKKCGFSPKEHDKTTWVRSVPASC